VASIGKDPGGRRRILFIAADGKRKTIRLGRVNQRTAVAVKVKVEALNTAAITGQPVDDEVARWVAGLDTLMADKLASVGLIPRRASATLGAFIGQYADGRIDVKPSTKTAWSQVTRNLLDYFGADRPLRSITAGDGDGFKLFLIRDGLAPMTVHKRLQFARQLFRAASRHKIIDSNPFAEVKAPAVMDSERRRFVTRGETQAVLEACPNHHWRSIVALARFGGLRCPSEVLSLRWQDINWETGRMRVTSPKTEHHPGKDSRVVPLFPELRPHLEEAFERAPEGAVYVVDERFRKSALGPTAWRNSNLRTTFAKIVRRAGLVPWERLFQSLRSSRETELTERFPLHVVTGWLGNTPKIAFKHYLQTTEEHFQQALAVPEEAAQNPAQQPAARARNTLRSGTKANGGTGPNVVPCNVLRNDVNSCCDNNLPQVGATGFEPATF